MLSIEPGLLIWTIITFAILLIVLRKIAWKPLLSALEQRESTIRNSLDEAQRVRQESEQLLAENRRILANANRESARILEQGREEAERLRREQEEAEAAAERKRLGAERAEAEAETKREQAAAAKAQADADAMATRAQELLRQLELIALHAVVREYEPPARPLLRGMAPIARHRLRKGRLQRRPGRA